MVPIPLNQWQFVSCKTPRCWIERIITINFVEVNFTDFVNNLLVVESNEAEAPVTVSDLREIIILISASK